MRVIKFRAWDKKNKKMLAPKGALVEDMMFDYGNHYDHIGPDQAILMQYTGLKDKNGVEIYEGDIVEWSYPDNWCFEKGDKKKHPSAGKLMWTCEMKWMKRGAGFNLPDSWYVPKVIGNIYEKDINKHKITEQLTHNSFDCENKECKKYVKKYEAKEKGGDNK